MCRSGDGKRNILLGWPKLIIIKKKCSSVPLTHLDHLSHGPRFAVQIVSGTQREVTSFDTEKTWQKVVREPQVRPGSF